MIVNNIKYSKKDFLGQGAFAKVYKGYMYDGNSKQNIAIKEISKNEYTSDPMEREVPILEKCNHENIIKFIGVYHVST